MILSFISKSYDSGCNRLIQECTNSLGTNALCETSKSKSRINWYNMRVLIYSDNQNQKESKFTACHYEIPSNHHC